MRSFYVCEILVFGTDVAHVAYKQLSTTYTGTKSANRVSTRPEILEEVWQEPVCQWGCIRMSHAGTGLGGCLRNL
jgi:hypothetical protein